MGRLDNKVAIVTGGSSGLGAATAKLFANQGATVVVFARNQEKGEKFVSELTDKGFKVEFFKVDVSDREGVANAYKTAFEKYGKIDILVNNAGLMTNHGMPDDKNEKNLAAFDMVLKVNLMGVYNCAAEVIEYMRKSGGGSIINVSSIVSIQAEPENPAYGISKSGVNGITMQFAISYGPENIRSNTILPGMCDTEGAAESYDISEEEQKYYANLVPLKRLAKSEDIANVMLFLASDDSSYINGADIVVDGGYTKKMFF